MITALLLLALGQSGVVTGTVPSVKFETFAPVPSTLMLAPAATSEVRFVCGNSASFTLADVREALKSATEALPVPPAPFATQSVPAIYLTPQSEGDELRERAARADQRDRAAVQVDEMFTKVVEFEACMRGKRRDVP